MHEDLFKFLLQLRGAHSFVIWYSAPVDCDIYVKN